MSLLSTKDFCKVSGVKIGTLRQHLNRGKVVKTNKHIDTEHPTNVVYLQEQWEKYGKPVQEPILSKEKTPSPGITAESLNIPAPTSTDLTYRKKMADALISERRAIEIQLKNQKLQGKLMPIDFVQKTLVINLQSVFRSFESSAENIASIYNERLGGDRASLAEMISRMRMELERAIKSAKDMSKIEIEALMVEYQESRSRGEKK
jgi:hypothetical protein